MNRQTAQAKTYGNTLATLKKSIIIGLVIAAVLYLIFGITAWVQGGWEKIHVAFLWPVVLIPACVGGIIPLFVLPTMLTNIRIEDGNIYHLLLNRKVLSTKRIESLTGIDLGRGMFAVVLYFDDGSKIRFLGAHVAQCSRLCNDLLRLTDREIRVTVVPSSVELV